MRAKSIILIILLMFWGVLVSNAQDAPEDVSVQAYRVVNVRSAPFVDSEILTQLHPEESAPVLARSNENNDWLLIQVEDAQGWVAYFVVAVSGDLSALPIQEVQPDSNQETIVETAELSLESAGVSAVAFRRANVRLLPSTNSEVIAILERGSVVPVLARSSEDNDWIQIETEQGVGWVAYYLVTINGDLDELPIIEHEPIPEPTATQAAVDSLLIVTRYNVNLRTEPTLTSETIAVIPFESELTADARDENGRWIRVEYEGETGWLLAALVTPQDSGDITSLPVAN